MLGNKVAEYWCNDVNLFSGSRVSVLASCISEKLSNKMGLSPRKRKKNFLSYISEEK